MDYIYGIVLYTGQDTKLMQNIKHSLPKLSYIEIQLSTMIYYIILIMLGLSAISTGLGINFKENNKINNGVEAAYYIYPKLSDNKFVLSKYVQEVFQIFAAFYINYTSFLPLSLMIVIEVIKPIQVIFINSDEEMKVEKEGEEEFKPLSYKLQENLGAVKYIFADKTGTITKNEMLFHSCSIFGDVFEHEDKTVEDKEGSNNKDQTIKTLFTNLNVKSCIKKEIENENESPIYDEDNPFTSVSLAVIEFLIGISLNHNILPEVNSDTKEVSYTGSSPDEVALITSIRELGVEFIGKICSL